jgi:hypothetical protein
LKSFAKWSGNQRRLKRPRRNPAVKIPTIGQRRAGEKPDRPDADDEQQRAGEPRAEPNAQA